MFQKYLIIIPIIGAILALSINLNKPFIGHHDYTSSFNGMIARNYLEYGVWPLKFGQVPGFVSSPLSNHHSFYTHYLPLLPLLIALSYTLFGVTEWATRLVPAIFSLIGVISLYLICQKLWSPKIALFACVFFIFNPMFIYFGNMPVAEPVIIGMMLLAFYFYLRWIKLKKNKYFFALAISLFIGGLVGWPICYLGPLLILHSLLIKKFDRKLIILQLILLLTIVLMLVHTYILTGNFFGGGLLDTLKSRLAEQNFGFGGETYNLTSFIRKEISWLQAYFTRILLIFAFLGFLFQIRSKMSFQKATLITFLLFGVLHIIIFSRYVFVHDFLNIYLLPFLTLSGALGAGKLITFLKNKQIDKVVVSLIVILIFAIFLTERLEFTKALLATKMNKPGQDMAYLINNLQTKRDEVILVSPRFNDFFGVFSYFYSKYPYRYTSEEDFKKSKDYEKYKYLITIDEDAHDQDLYQFLSHNYSHQKINDLTIFKTR